MEPTTYEEMNQANKERLQRLLDLIGNPGGSALEIGARYGIVTRFIAERFNEVTALDLQRPDFSIPGVETVAGDVTDLHFGDRSFDHVICTEVLEHIPPPLLKSACDELARVTRSKLIVGVPYKQDIRLGRTTCRACGLPAPPYGHVNSFDEKRLRSLFPKLEPRVIDFVGPLQTPTNAFSTLLMDLADNPWGTYAQVEPCINCGSALELPREIATTQRILAGMAARLTRLQNRISKGHPTWIHIAFERH